MFHPRWRWTRLSGAQAVKRSSRLTLYSVISWRGFFFPTRVQLPYHSQFFRWNARLQWAIFPLEHSSPWFSRIMAANFPTFYPLRAIWMTTKKRICFLRSCSCIAEAPCREKPYALSGYCSAGIFFWCFYARHVQSDLLSYQQCETKIDQRTNAVSEVFFSAQRWIPRITRGWTRFARARGSVAVAAQICKIFQNISSQTKCSCTCTFSE